jgi:hypothetical protein
MPRSKPRLRFLHPLLFGLVPILSLLAHNIDGAPLLHAVRPTAISLLFSLAVLLAFRGLVKDWEHAALLSSFLLMLFFSYGHVYLGLVVEGTQGFFRSLGIVGRHDVLLLAWAGVFALGAFAIYRIRTLRPVLTQLFLVMGAVALLFPILQIGSHEVQLARPWPGTPPLPLAGRSAGRPDIYLIILDGYARADILADIYGFDNRGFRDSLRDRGFYVAARSRSNYIQTGLSLASILNMSYLDFLSEDLGELSDNRTPLARLIRWSRLREFLEQSGYSIVGLASGYRVTELENADVYLAAPVGAPTTLERLTLETSATVVLRDLASALGQPPLLPGYEAHRERMLFSLETLKQVPQLPGPKFVLAHFLIPHPPFVFDANGNAPEQKYPFTMMDGSAFLGSTDEYIQGYRQQVAYTNRVILEVVDAILSESAGPPVIVIQGDHGPGSRLVWESAEETDLQERSSILNAYHLPGFPVEKLYPELTPVNSFRLILDQYFGTGLGLLPDRSYFSTWDQPYQFIPID